jgi:ATP-dependent 26S proteasome regulatory subunit
MPGQIKNVIGYFNNHDELKQKNVRIFNRVLLHGKPGAGKTHLVKVLSDELQVPLLKFSASFFADKYIGESSRRIRMAFDVVKKHEGPIFIFIDEIDALAPKRSENMHQEHRARSTRKSKCFYIYCNKRRGNYGSCLEGSFRLRDL